MNGEEICAGDTLGRYELLVPIAKGGTAEVWAARSKGARGFEKIVAIKLMLAEFSDDIDAETMFLDEARLVSQIRNPNVAEVLDLGEHNTALFIVMEWVDGEPLQVIAREVARSKGGVPLPLSVAVRIIRQVCNGLHAAHEVRDSHGKLAGIVHRDVSPQNILVGYDGTVKMIDFGVAKAASNLQRTNVGQLKGKVAYMAPEQAFGDPVDRRTDVFALGIVFYQLITGKHPFRGDNEFATLGRIRDKTPAEPPSVHLRGIPKAIEQVILKALAKNPAERFASMVEFSRALEDAFPATDVGTEEVSVYMKTLLGARGEKKRQAIREAIKAVEEHRAQSAVPAAFQVDAQSITGALDRSLLPGFGGPTPAGSLDRSAIPSPPTGGGASSRVAPLGPPPLYPSQSSQSSGSSTTGPLDRSGISTGDRSTEGSLLPGRLVASSVEPPIAAPNFRRRGGSGRFVVAAIAILVVLGLVIWGVTSESTDPGATSGETPVKKPW